MIVEFVRTLGYEWHHEQVDCPRCEGRHGGEDFRYHLQPNGDAVAVCPATGQSVVVKPLRPLPPGFKLPGEE